MARKQLSDITEMIGKTVVDVGMEKEENHSCQIIIGFSDETEIRIEAIIIEGSVLMGAESQLPELIELRRMMEK